MGNISFQISVSLDGFVAGPNQSLEEPLGIGGEALHEWVVPLRSWREAHGLEDGVVNASNDIMIEATSNVGAYIMGRNMFGGGPGPWGQEPWQGWWGDEPPFHSPVYVLTHHPREPLELKGGTTFYFVQDGIVAAADLAREAAGGKNVAIGGGAQTIQQALQAGLVSEFWMHVVPILLGSGARLLDGLSGIRLELLQTVAGDGVSHLNYRVLQ